MGGLTSPGPPEAEAAASAAAMDVWAFGVRGGVGGWPEALLVVLEPPIKAADNIPEGKFEGGEGGRGWGSSDFDAEKNEILKILKSLQN